MAPSQGRLLVGARLHPCASIVTMQCNLVPVYWLCDWEGNRRSSVMLAERYRILWSNDLRARSTQQKRCGPSGSNNETSNAGRIRLHLEHSTVHDQIVRKTAGCESEQFIALAKIASYSLLSFYLTSRITSLVRACLTRSEWSPTIVAFAVLEL